MKSSIDSRTTLLGAVVFGLSVAVAGGGLAACGSSSGSEPGAGDDSSADDASSDSAAEAAEATTGADASKKSDASTPHDASTTDSATDAGSDAPVSDAGSDGSTTDASGLHEASTGDSAADEDAASGAADAAQADAGAGDDAASSPEAGVAEGGGDDAAVDATTGDDAAVDATTGDDAAVDATAGDDAAVDATAGDDASTVDSGAGVDASTDDAGPDASATYATCYQILQANPSAGSGTYGVTVGSDTLTVYCDMSFDGGGWTLVESTNGGSCAPDSTTVGTVTLGSCASVALADVEALAALSSSVHIRTASGTSAPTQYIQSVDSIPITNLRSGSVLNANVAVGCGGASGTPDYYRVNCPIQAAEEEAPWVVVGDPGNVNSEYGAPVGTDWSATILDFGCDPTGETWPDVYHACDNGLDGFHLVETVSTWNWSTQTPSTALEVYIR